MRYQQKLCLLYSSYIYFILAPWYLGKHRMMVYVIFSCMLWIACKKSINEAMLYIGFSSFINKHKCVSIYGLSSRSWKNIIDVTGGWKTQYSYNICCIWRPISTHLSSNKLTCIWSDWFLIMNELIYSLLRIYFLVH